MAWYNWTMQCRLCDENANLDALWVTKGEYWNVHACWFQHTLGTLGIILKRHVESFTDLTKAEIQELGELLKAHQIKLTEALNPDWFNIQMNGNWHHHLHFLLLPRYEDTKEFNGKSYTDETYKQPITYTKMEESFKNREALTKLLSNY